MANGDSKSERSRNDAVAPIGMGVTDSAGRILASLFGQGPPELVFTHSLDVSNVGVLLALPALLNLGLLTHLEYLSLPDGYYRLDSILVLLAFMALAQVKNIVCLRCTPSGEWGKLLGLDRIPEAKTLRNKVRLLTEGGAGTTVERCPEPGLDGDVSGNRGCVLHRRARSRVPRQPDGVAPS